jgi:hypothetical protein
MHIREIDATSIHDRNKFIQFPFHLYKENKQWVPPFISDMHFVMNRQKYPFYQHSDGTFFVCESGSEVLGRIAVLHNTNYCKFHNLRTAFFYFFESIDDLQIASNLFDAAFSWGKKRDLTQIYGPRGFSRVGCNGILTKGFEYMPAMNITYNFPYYPAFMEKIGFVPETDYLSGYITRDTFKIPQKVAEMAEKIAKRNDLWVKTFRNKAEMKTLIPEVDAIHSAAFENNPAYYPSTKEEFELIANGIVQLADPGLIKMIMKGNEVAGFIIAYHDLSKALQRTKGQMAPLGWIEFLKEKKQTNVVDLNGVGILPKFQGTGANILLYYELIRTLMAYKQFDRAEFIQVDVRNFKSKSDSETMGVNWHKCHRTYQMEI